MEQAQSFGGSTTMQTIPHNSDTTRVPVTTHASAQTETEFNQLIDEVSQCKNKKLKAEICHAIAMTFKKADSSILHPYYMRNAPEKNAGVTESFDAYCRRHMYDYLEQASKAGHTNAIFELGEYYLEQTNDIEAALLHYETAAHHNPPHAEAAYQAGCLYEEAKVAVGLFTNHQKKAVEFFKIAADGTTPHPLAAAKMSCIHEARIGFFSWTDHQAEARRYEAIAFGALNHYETAVLNGNLSQQQFDMLKEELILILGGEKLTELGHQTHPITAIDIGDQYWDKTTSVPKGSSEYTRYLEKALRYYEIALHLHEPNALAKLELSEQLRAKERFENARVIHRPPQLKGATPAHDTL